MSSSFGGSRSSFTGHVVFEIIARDETAASIVSLYLWDRGVQGVEEREGFDQTVVLRSSFGLDSKETEAALKEMFTIMESDLRNTTCSELIESWDTMRVDPAIADTWKAFAGPVSISDRLEVVPAWIEHDPSERVDSNPASLLIDPGATFGMGDHPTTRGSLMLLERFIEKDSTVLDVGCGSGILGIASILLGASRARGLDIDPAAVPVSRANAERNGVESNWSVSLEPLHSVDEEFDIVLANILAPTLIELAIDLKRVLRERGVLIVSGVLRGAYDHVLRALEPLQLEETVHIESWTAISLRSANS